MNIHFFIGTKAQLIKMAPIMVELQQRGVAYRYVDSGQHSATTYSLRRMFGLPEPNFMLREAGQDIISISEALRWYGGLLRRSLTDLHWLKNQVFPQGGICLIHGDTLSTLLGLQLARRAGLKIAHVEAGLRSHRLFDPFPEELIRIHCMKRADLLFAPSNKSTENLRNMRVNGQVIPIGSNTVLDTLRLMETYQPTIELPDTPFALATCHRLETISNRKRLAKVVALFNQVAERIPLVLVIHGPTRRKLEHYGLSKQLLPQIKQQGLLDYGDFLLLQKRASLVLSDGGSIQEECAALDKPCLILRNTTERLDGIGQNATLWQFDAAIAKRFLDNVLLDKKHLGQVLSSSRPSAVIVNTLLQQSSDHHIHS